MREQRMRQYLMRAAGYALAALSLCLLVCVLVVLLAALRGCCGRSRKQKVRKRRPRTTSDTVTQAEQLETAFGAAHTTVYSVQGGGAVH